MFKQTHMFPVSYMIIYCYAFNLGFQNNHEYTTIYTIEYNYYSASSFKLT